MFTMFVIGTAGFAVLIFITFAIACVSKGLAAQEKDMRVQKWFEFFRITGALLCICFIIFYGIFCVWCAMGGIK